MQNLETERTTGPHGPTVLTIGSCRAHGCSGLKLVAYRRLTPCFMRVFSRVFAIYQILLGCKTCKCYHETDELPPPKANPTQEKTLE